MKKLLITGAGGFLGSHLVDLAKSQYEVYGFSNSSPINLSNERCYYFDLRLEKRLIEALDSIQPDTVIHCAAISGESGCRNNRDEAYTINVKATETIGNWCENNQARMIFTSTDLVFDGNQAPYKESDFRAPLMEYGKLKVKAEECFKRNLNSVVLRLPLLYGIGLGHKRGLLNQFIKNIKAEKVQRLFVDEYRTPAFVKDIASFIIKLIESDFTGTLNLGGRERISRYDLGKLFIDQFKLDSNFIEPITRADIKMRYRPKDTSMDSSVAYKLGYQPRKIDVALRAISSHYFE